MSRLDAFLADETGTASIEFVLVVPLILTIFFASFESSYFMVRHVSLERSVDILVRDIRLGKMDFLKTMTQAEQHASLKSALCTISILNTKEACIDSMTIWLQAINTADFAMVAPPRSCVDRTEPINPSDPGPASTEFKFGEDNEIMLMRICLKEEPMFPTTIVGAGLIKDGEADGHYALMTTSVFVNEPG